MDDTTLLGLIAGGALACLIYFASTFGSREDRKMRSRLNSSTGPAPAKAHQPQGVSSVMSQIGQAAAKPLMPTTREKISSARRNLGFAGIYNPSAVKTLYGSKFIFLIAGIIVGNIAGMLTGQTMLCLPVGALIGLFAPVMWVNKRIKKNQKALDYGLADALDLMVVCVEAGLTVDSAMQRVGGELAPVHPALSRELAIAHMEMRVGLTRSEALRNLGIRTGNTALQSLSAMLVQADRFGTSIAQALRVHAESLRITRQQKAEEMAAKTSVKLSFPLVLFIFPATFIILVGPTIIELMKSPLMK